MAQGLRLEDTKKLTKFDTVRQMVAVGHSRKNEDVVVEMKQLRITPELNIEVPHVGTMSMSPWAKRQMGQMLGVQWDRWFNPDIVNHIDIQEEIQKRFRRTNEERKIRTNRFSPDEVATKGADGYIRAVLSPTYHPIDDEKIFDRLEQNFNNDMSGFGFLNGHFQDNDHCNYYTLVANEPVNIGPLDRSNKNAKVRRIYDAAEREGKLPAADYIYPGMSMRNSEVGYSAFTVDEFSFRLICLNGAIMCVGDSRLMYRQHRPIENGELDKQLNKVFNAVPKRWETTKRNYEILASIQVVEPEKEIIHQLTKLGATKVFQESVIKAFDLEPIDTMYGVLQAITRAAKDTVNDTDKRFELESMAGMIVASASHLRLAA